MRGYANPDVGVVRGEYGRPRLVFSELMAARLTQQGIGAAHVSLSDDDGRVLAFVVLERAPLPNGPRVLT